MADEGRKNDSTRRGFIKASTAVAGVTLMASTATARTLPDDVPTLHADVIVVGSGGGGLSAAIAARRAGATVIVLEKGGALGGTTAKSGGGVWVPNNHLLRAAGGVDPKAAAVAYMASTAWPGLFRAQSPKFGLGHAYDMIEAYYDNAAAVFEDLERAGVVEWLMSDFPNYNDRSPYNADPERSHRTLFPKGSTGPTGGGQSLMRALREWCSKNDIKILTRHEVRDLVQAPDGRVMGVKGVSGDTKFVAVASKGVIFATGGFSQNRQLMQHYISPALMPGCASTNAQGDFIAIATRAGAQLGNMLNGWKAQVVVEDVVANGSVPQGVWSVPGDSSILLNKYGRRVVDEKRGYHNRTQAHMTFDPLEEEYPNRLLFMVYDQRTAELCGGVYPMPSVPTGAPYVISAPTLSELKLAVQARLDALENAFGTTRLSDDFDTCARAQIERFNSDTVQHADDEFGRDKYGFDLGASAAAISLVEKLGITTPNNDRWSMQGTFGSRHPISLDGPFYCIILGGGLLDTNGGPVIDIEGRVLHVDGHPIRGLYGTGNCIASPAGGTYWGAGSTLGPAITFGTLAGRSVVRGGA